MSRLLIAMVVMLLAVVWLMMGGTEKKPEIIYQKNVDAAKGVEQTIQDQAKNQLQAVDKATTEPKDQP